MIGKQEILDSLITIKSFDSKYNDIFEKVVWLEVTISSDYDRAFIQRYSNDDNSIYGEIFNGIITSKQVITFTASIQSSRACNIQRAYHHLCDFIDNGGINLLDPLSPFELFCIKQLIDAITSIRKEYVVMEGRPLTVL